MRVHVIGQVALFMREGLSMVLHNIKSIIEQLSIRLRLNSGVIDNSRVYVRWLTSWGRPDIGFCGINGGGVGHGVGRGHGTLPLVVHAVSHVVVGVIPRGQVVVLLREVQLSPHICIGLGCVLPFLVSM